MIRKLQWQDSSDLSNVLSVQWGIQNVDKAIEEFEASYGQVKRPVVCVSRSKPWLAASPDAILGSTHVVEVSWLTMIQHSWINSQRNS